jgi:hypothetical protein
MSRERYSLLRDAIALHSNGPIRGHKENTAPVLLAAYVLRPFPSNGHICRNTTKLREDYDTFSSVISIIVK